MNPRVCEKQEQAAIVKLLRLIGAQVYVLGTKRKRGDFQGTCQTPGIPDVFAFLPKPKTDEYRASAAMPIWIEVKTATGRPSIAQVGFREWCEVSRHRYFMGTADGFASYLRDLGYVK